MKNRSHKARWILLLLGVFVCLLGIWFWQFGLCRSTSLCSVCGARQSQSVVLFVPFRRLEATKLSRLYEEIQGNSKHRHQWSFEHGGGGQISCAIGEASYLSGMPNDADLERCLKAIRLHRGDREATDWIRRILDIKMAEEMRWIQICPHQQDDVETSEGFELWYKKAKEYSQLLEEVRNRTKQTS